MPKNKLTLNEFKFNITKGVLANAGNLVDKALLLEKEIGLDPIYTMISMGQSLTALASSLGVSTFELEFMLKRTSIHMKKYLNAKTLALSDASTTALNQRSDHLVFETEDAAAMKHHSSMLDKSLKILNAPTVDTGTGNIVVNNTVVVRSKDEVPPLPDELNIIEGESC